MFRRSPAILALLSLPTLACSSQGEAAPTDGGTTSDADAASACKAVPAPQLGTSAEAVALAAAPAACGQKAFTWLATPDLGDVTQKGFHDHFTATANKVLLVAGKVDVKGPVHDVDMDQIAYVTQDRGAKIEATALVAYPSDLEARTDLDVLVVLHGTAGFTDSCAPSASADARPLAAALASLGYVVVAPDYVGLRALGAPTGFLHPYLVGQTTAIASIDAVRASQKLLQKGELGVCAKPRFVTVGGSQGGHAALWVDRLAPYYAKELEHAGVVATVPPADMLGEAGRALRADVPASKNILAFYGAASGWYGYEGRLGEVLISPWDKDVPAAMAKSCDPKLDASTRDAYFQKSFLDTAATEGGLSALSPWGCMLTENGLTTTSVKRMAPTGPGYGVLFVVGEADTLVDPATERKAFDTLCGQGMKMQYLECAGAAHTKATTWSLPEIVDFVGARLAGVPMKPADLCARGAAQKCRGTP